MRFRFLLINFIVSLTVFSVLPYVVLGISPSSITVNVIPENPRPNENTDITLSSFAANLDSVLISWSVNGKSVLSGIGKKSFSITAPAAGSETDIRVRILLPDGEIEKTISIRPNVMILLWQAMDSFVPPFYKGKAMPTLDSEIKIVAMPEIKNNVGLVDSKNMTYAWKRDYSNEAEGSGYGKNYFLYTGDYLEGSSNIGVVATTVDQNYSSSANITVGAVEPEISFYKKDSELGIIWERVLPPNHRIEGSEIVVAVPYFISPGDIRRPELIFNWFINDVLTSVSNFRKNLMPLRVEEGTTGVSKLRLEIENTDKIFQTVSKEIELEF